MFPTISLLVIFAVITPKYRTKSTGCFIYKSFFFPTITLRKVSTVKLAPGDNTLVSATVRPSAEQLSADLGIFGTAVLFRTVNRPKLGRPSLRTVPSLLGLCVLTYRRV